MASALVDYARRNAVEPIPENVSEFHIYSGEGIHGKIDGNSIHVGNKRIAVRVGGQTVPEMEDVNKGITVGYIFSNASLVGRFTLSDTCRTGATEAIEELKSLGVKTAMLTGDSKAAAMHAQIQLGNAIEIIHAELLPEDKVRIIKDLKNREGPTAMVGDGMNNTAALAMANVGISMGISGSAVATETSHITLMSNDVCKIPKAIQLARRTHCKIIWNILFSGITKVAILVLAFAGHPIVWAAVLADVGTCLLVILNSMMLMSEKTPKKNKCCSYRQKSQVCCSNKRGCQKNEKAHEHDCNGHKDSSKDGSHSHACEHGSNNHTKHKHDYNEHDNVHACNAHQHKKTHKHTYHGHEKAHKHDCHDQGKAKRGRKYNYLSSCKRQHCYMESSENIHCAESVMKATLEHLVSIACIQAHQNVNFLEEHPEKHITCSCKKDVAEDGNTYVGEFGDPQASNVIGTCLEMNKSTHKEIGGLVQMPEIIIE